VVDRVAGGPAEADLEPGRAAVADLAAETAPAVEAAAMALAAVDLAEAGAVSEAPVVADRAEAPVAQAGTDLGGARDPVAELVLAADIHQERHPVNRARRPEPLRPGCRQSVFRGALDCTRERQTKLQKFGRGHPARLRRDFTRMQVPEARPEVGRWKAERFRLARIPLHPQVVSEGLAELACRVPEVQPVDQALVASMLELGTLLVEAVGERRSIRMPGASG